MNRRRKSVDWSFVLTRLVGLPALDVYRLMMMKMIFCNMFAGVSDGKLSNRHILLSKIMNLMSNVRFSNEWTKIMTYSIQPVVRA